MEIRTLYIPKGLIDAIRRVHWQCTHVNTILNAISTGGVTIAIIGDPSNGSYEWVAWDEARNAIVDRSDDGWGCPASAMRHALNKFDG